MNSSIYAGEEFIASHGLKKSEMKKLSIAPNIALEAMVLKQKLPYLIRICDAK